MIFILKICRQIRKCWKEVLVTTFKWFLCSYVKIPNGTFMRCFHFSIFFASHRLPLHRAHLWTIISELCFQQPVCALVPCKRIAVLPPSLGLCLWAVFPVLPLCIYKASNGTWALWSAWGSQCVPNLGM